MSTNHNARSRSTHTGPSPSSAASGQTSFGSLAAILPPARIHEMLVTGHSARIVRSEKKDKRGDIFGYQPVLEALRFDDFGFAFGRVPLHLPRRLHVAGDDAIHPDIVAA